MNAVRLLSRHPVTRELERYALDVRPTHRLHYNASMEHVWCASKQPISLIRWGNSELVSIDSKTRVSLHAHTLAENERYLITLRINDEFFRSLSTNTNIL